MNRDDSTPLPERHIRAALRPWEALFLLAFAASIIGAACWQSHKSYLNNDELLTATLVANSDFGAMWNAIRRGGELNPPLFFVVEWVVAHTVGTGELTLRMISMVSMALAGWVMFFTMRPTTGPRLAALAVVTIFGLSREVFGFAVSARYYALLLLLVCTAAFLGLRLNSEAPRRRWHYAAVFLTHCAMAYLHLYGLLYSGVLFTAMLLADWLKRKPRWGIYFSVVAAWASFGAWIPSMRQQYGSVAGGVFVPENMLDLGFFLDQLPMGTPLALVILLSAGLAGLALVCARPNKPTEEWKDVDATGSWAALILMAMALMAVPITTWTASHWMHPPPYMLRYSFPIIAAWVIIIGLILLGLHRFEAGKTLKRTLPPWLWTLAWLLVLAICLVFQPLRARKNSPRPATPFTDADFGHANLPIVFENSWFYLQRAWYGHGREYAMVIDREAGETDPGWYTKNMYREFRWFSPRYGRLTVLDWDHLPDWPDGFIAVDDDYTQTFDRVFARTPGLRKELLGTVQWEPVIFGQQRIYLVTKRK